MLSPDIQFSTRPFNVGDAVLASRMQKGDLDALVTFLIRRCTAPLTEADIWGWSAEELNEAAARLAAANQQAEQLAALSALFQEEAGDGA